MHAFSPEPLPTPQQARRNLVVGGTALALTAIIGVVAVIFIAVAAPFGIRGSGVARIEVVDASAQPSTDAGSPGDAGHVFGAVDLHTHPIARTEASTTATVELVGDSADRARLIHLRGGTWVPAGDSLALARADAAEGVAVRVVAREDGQDGEWNGTVTVRWTVTQGMLPDTDEIDVHLFES